MKKSLRRLIDGDDGLFGENPPSPDQVTGVRQGWDDTVGDPGGSRLTARDPFFWFLLAVVLAAFGLIALVVLGP